MPYVYWLHDPTPDQCPSYCSFALTPEYIHPLLSGPPYQNFRVELTAVPDPGWYFAGWTGLCAGGGATCEIPFAVPGAVSVNLQPLPAGHLVPDRAGLADRARRADRAHGLGERARRRLLRDPLHVPARRGDDRRRHRRRGRRRRHGPVDGVRQRQRRRLHRHGLRRHPRLDALAVPADHRQGLAVRRRARLRSAGFLATCAAAQTSCQFLLDPGARVRLQRTVSYPSNNANYRATLGWQGCAADSGNADACTLQVDGPTSAAALFADEIRLQVSERRERPRDELARRHRLRLRQPRHLRRLVPVRHRRRR